MAEEKKEITQEKKPDKKNTKKIRWSIGIGIIFIIIILTILRINNPNFAFKWIAFIGGGVVIIGGLAFFFTDKISKYIYGKKGGEEKDISGIPKAAPTEVIEEELKKFISRRRNHIKEIVSVRPYSIGKNEIYCYHAKLLYNDGDNGKDIYVILNANYLKKPFGVEDISATQARLKSIANGLSSSPEESPDIEILEEAGPVPGTTRKVTRTTHKKKEKSKKKTEGEIQ